MKPFDPLAWAGQVNAVPLDDGSFGYAKALCFPEVAFLDRRGTETPDMALLAEAPVLFRIWVMKDAMRSRKNGWKRIGRLPLSDDDLTPHRYFREDRLSGRFFIMQRGQPDLPAVPGDLAGLERAAVWSRPHVESRLSDHFAGRESVWVRQLALPSG